jgi:hypothetical protein
VHEVARAAVREAAEIGSEIAFAEASRQAVQESTPIEPIDPAAHPLVIEPSVSTDDVPAVRIATTTPHPTINTLDRIAAVDGPTAGRATLFGHAAVQDDNGERLVDPVRRVSEQRHAALAKYRDIDVTPFAPHARGALISANDRLPNQPMVRIAGSCQCTDRWQDHLLPKE